MKNSRDIQFISIGSTSPQCTKLLHNSRWETLRTNSNHYLIPYNRFLHILCRFAPIVAVIIANSNFMLNLNMQMMCMSIKKLSKCIRFISKGNVKRYIGLLGFKYCNNFKWAQTCRLINRSVVSKFVY